ncbi:MAG: hypothetical protein ACREAU_00515 [Nitrosopumilaceae archaeon]
MIIEDILTRISASTAQILEDLETLERHYAEYDDLLKMQPEIETFQEIISSYL